MYQASVCETIRLRAGLAMRGPGANQQTELFVSCTNATFSDLDLIDPLPLLFNDLLTRSAGLDELTFRPPPVSSNPLVSSASP